MADYRELLRRAIDALPENNGTARRAVYEKARSALVTQLHAIEPPIPAREITQHRLTLEDCIRQVEQEATEKLLQGLSHREQEATVEQAVPTPSMPEEVAVEPQPAAPVEEPEAEVEAEVETAVETETLAVDEVEPAEETSTTIEELVDEAEQAPEQAEYAAEHVASDDGADDSFEQAPIEEEFSVEEQDASSVVEDHQPEEEDALEEQTEAVVEEAPISSQVDVEEPEDQSDVSEEDASEPEVADVEQDAQEEEQASEIDETADDDDENSDLVAQLEELGDDTPSEYTANSVDDVIAQARAAAGLNAPTPNVVSAEPVANNNVEAALSSVREVDVDPEDLRQSDEDDDDAQAAIDRALLALDREAEGKHEPSADEALLSETSKGAIAAAAEKETSKPELVEESEDFVEDEQSGGGGGLLVFLGVFVLLIGLLGGGTYWAWREGYVNLDPVLAQVGLSDLISNPTNGDTGETPQPTDTSNTETPPQTNVRDVTPANTGNNTAPGTSDTGGEAPRLTPEEPSDQTDSATTDAATTDDSAAATGTDTPATDTPTDDASGTDTATASDDARLPSEDDSVSAEDTTENPLNVQDPTAQATAGSQSLLIEEQTSGAGGAVPFSGQTQWTRDVDELGIPTIRASASIPARNLSVDMLIRKNSDEALPASHLVEVNFTVTDSFLGGSIASLPGVLMKDQELAQGTTLVGASVRIVDNSFLFAMSGSENDVARNLELLGQNGWLDLPLIYGTGRKAILTLEKGAAGTQIFEEVLAEWAAN
ncbi:hypothetical protein ATL17_1344 [Maritalea mobilis]|uniref:Uncharacterized protein n=1 Tax=Maritalea mobilis TaxID=483324 RepID=A0A4R6VTB9_9HYPH|nr:hypothetical protein [Maritalea mobilis]TDQ67333.1 hypothetical protein ATL17_1344 [Maritalea mobilis]